MPTRMITITPMITTMIMRTITPTGAITATRITIIIIITCRPTAWAGRSPSAWC